jgi:hypothetical protein
MKTERLTKFITLAQLRNLGACVDQLEIFEPTFYAAIALAFVTAYLSQLETESHHV